MYWNCRRLSESLSINGQRYPNLFSYTISDLHSYSKCGKFLKTNCYSTFFDLISGKGNTAAVFKNYSKSLADYLINAKSGKELYANLKKIHKELVLYKYDLVKRIEAAELVSGGVRAEFRVRLCDLVSVAQGLDEFFSAERIRYLSLNFESSLIVNYAKFNVELLFKQILANLVLILRDLESNHINNFELMERITTISVFESLLTTTLFTGMTYSFAGNLVWNKSTVGVVSLELMKSIKLLDRPVFPRQFFSENTFKVSASEDILNRIFEKILRTTDFRFPPVKLLIGFEDENLTDKQKAEILWKVYFEELNPNSFLQGPRQKWKLDSLDQMKITTIRGGLRFRGAVRGIFNFENFEQYGAWKNKYYLKLAKSWLQRQKNNISISILESLLVQAIRDLGIEYVHCPGEETYDCYPSMRQSLDLSDRTDSETLQFIMTRDIEQVRVPETRAESDRREREEMLSVRNLTSKVKKWEWNEYESLFRGIVIYGEGKWTKFISDRNLYFVNPRNERSLGVKWRSLKSSGVVIYNQDSKRWAVAEGYRNDYPEFDYQNFRFDTLVIPRSRFSGNNVPISSAPASNNDNSFPDDLYFDDNFLHESAEYLHDFNSLNQNNNDSTHSNNSGKFHLIIFILIIFRASFRLIIS